MDPSQIANPNRGQEMTQAVLVLIRLLYDCMNNDSNYLAYSNIQNNVKRSHDNWKEDGSNGSIVLFGDTNLIVSLTDTAAISW